MKFRPCIDIYGGKIRQIVGKSYSENNEATVNFTAGKSLEYYVSLFQKDKLYGGHIIMLGQGNEDVARKALNLWNTGFQIGGGINLSNALMWLKQGAQKIIISSYIFNEMGDIDFPKLQLLVKKIGRDNITLDLSCSLYQKEYFVMIDKWQRYTKIIINKNTLQMLSPFCGEFLVHAINNEGMKQGIDTNLVKILSQYTEKPIVYAGGIHTMEDIQAIEKISTGQLDFTVGSALDIYGGKMSYNKIVRRYS